MKNVRLHFLLTVMLSVIALAAGAQSPSCTPDTTMRDSILFIRPAPYNPETAPQAGIYDTARVGRPFEFTFTLLVPKSVDFPGLGMVNIAKVSFNTQTGITYNPPLANFSYACNPPNCVFLADSIGCVKIFGTAQASEIGQHDLLFVGTVDIGVPFPITFPNASLFPGNYILHVKEATSGIADLSQKVAIQVQPNPFSGLTRISLSSAVSGRFDFQVFDMLGQQVHRRSVNILEGENSIEFDGSALPEGMYLFTLTDGRASTTQRMVLSRR